MLPYTIPDPNNRKTIADWAEFSVTYTSSGLSKMALAASIEASSASEADEAIIDSAWQELEYREFLYGEQPPFEVQGDMVKASLAWEDVPEYMACLIFALEGNATDSVTSGILFERISNEAVKNFIGGKSLRTGFPPRMPVKNIAQAINERFCYEPPSSRQDRDLDIVAWKDFGDDRSSQLILLMQCAAGRYWKDKKKDLNLDAWCKYIHFASRPVKGFSIPVIISDKKDLEEHSTDAGIILDRARIYRNVINGAPSDNLRDDLRAWCKQRLAEMLN